MAANYTFHRAAGHPNRASQALHSTQRDLYVNQRGSLVPRCEYRLLEALVASLNDYESSMSEFRLITYTLTDNL
eukprot:scaffold94165_cov38-Prasinocladus_malaysianus.AAC.2